ncbi:hypothetical protein HYV85_04230 [Candidatus Woesearchaeota archaeon]|nr:hypothetical protein [Candidatus Woesearchaeota archaeon]
MKSEEIAEIPDLVNSYEKFIYDAIKIVEHPIIDDVLASIPHLKSDLVNVIETVSLLAKRIKEIKKDIPDLSSSGVEADIEILRNHLGNLFAFVSELENKVTAGKSPADLGFFEHTENFKKSAIDIRNLTEHFNAIKDRLLGMYQEIATESLKIRGKLNHSAITYEVHKRFWRQYVHNKEFWLYHGTSVLFLDSIKKYGLDTSKLSRGIKRAIEIISDIYARAIPTPDLRHLSKVGVDTISGPIWLSGSNFKFRSTTFGLPRFIYELLDEAELGNLKEKLLSKLKEDERFVLRAIWRFGRILRKENKMALLAIKVDSNFLKYYDVPDFISDYDKFRDYVVEPCLKSGIYLEKTTNQGIFLWLHFAVISSGSKKIDVSGEMAVKVMQVPPELIYAEVKEALGSGFIPISELNEGVIPHLVLIG